MIQKPILSALEIPEEWPGIVRAIIERDGNAIRGPEDRPVIEVKSLTTNRWLVLELPNNGLSFSSIKDRDEILSKITDKIP